MDAVCRGCPSSGDCDGCGHYDGMDGEEFARAEWEESNAEWRKEQE